MSSDNCEFCLEFEKPKESFFHKLFSKYDISTRIIHQDSENIAIAGLGALTEGYVLLLPRKHSIAFSYLSTNELQGFETFMHNVLEILTEKYGELVCFEHGAASDSIRGGSCVDHAHLHICPSSVDLRTHLDGQFKHDEIESLLDLQSFAQHGRPYLFYQDQFGDKFVYHIPSQIESQYIRRVYAEAIGKPHEWDWSLFIGEEDILNTIKFFQS
ncbi:MAG: hypothetical protein KA003_02215 [Caldilineaceae bacterium]|nr:hypothetical protein [Caldilineaceae bacterium]MBP8106133.1 hypothetical protein [Caldilineaceae bacterium]MBP8122289.1 hypothetical protein [Caldilineaceae bacterium]